jgi:hypothetical protein
MPMTDLSALRKQIYDLNKERGDYLHRLLDIKSFMAAQVYERFKKCGNPNCKCARGELHGPFLWIYQKKKGQKVISTTVIKEKTDEARKLAGRYKELQYLRHLVKESDRRMASLLTEYASLTEREAAGYVKHQEKAGA